MSNNMPSTSKFTDDERLMNIFHKEIDKEISDRMTALSAISSNIKLCKDNLDRLRKVATTKFYMDSIEESEPVPQRSIHPAVKRLIGKRPATTYNGSAEQILRANERERHREAKRKRFQEMISSNYKHKSESKTSQEQSTSRNSDTQPCYVPHYMNGNSDESAPRGNTKKVLMRALVGNVAKEVDTVIEDSATHKWMVYIRSPTGSIAVESQVAKVCFFLHPSYKPHDVVTIVKPPFTLSRRGWGEFPMRIRIYFKNSLNKPADIFHHLKLNGTRSGHYTRSPETFAGIWIYPCVTQTKDEIDGETSAGQILILASNMMKERVPDFSSEVKCQKCSRTISGSDDCNCAYISANSSMQNSDQEESFSEEETNHDIMELDDSESEDSESSQVGPKFLGSVNTFSLIDHLDDTDNSGSSSDYEPVINNDDEHSVTENSVDKSRRIKSESHYNEVLTQPKFKAEPTENKLTSNVCEGNVISNRSNCSIDKKSEIEESKELVKLNPLDLDIALAELKEEVLDQNGSVDINVKQEFSDNLLNVKNSCAKIETFDELFTSIDSLINFDNLQTDEYLNYSITNHENSTNLAMADNSVQHINLNTTKENNSELSSRYFDHHKHNAPEEEVNPLSLDTEIIYDCSYSNQLFDKDNENIFSNSLTEDKHSALQMMSNTNSNGPPIDTPLSKQSSNLIEEEIPVFDFMNDFVEEEVIVESPIQNINQEHKSVIDTSSYPQNNSLNNSPKIAKDMSNVKNSAIVGNKPRVGDNLVAYRKNIYIPKKTSILNTQTAKNQSLLLSSKQSLLLKPKQSSLLKSNQPVLQKSPKSLLLKSQQTSLLQPKVISPKPLVSSTSINTSPNRSILKVPPMKNSQAVLLKNGNRSNSLLKSTFQSNYLNTENSVCSTEIVKADSKNVVVSNTSVDSPSEDCGSKSSAVTLNGAIQSKYTLPNLEAVNNHNLNRKSPVQFDSCVVMAPLLNYNAETLRVHKFSFDEFLDIICLPKTSVSFNKDNQYNFGLLVSSNNLHSDLASLSFDSLFGAKLVVVNKDQVYLQINQQVFYFLQQMRELVDTCSFAEMECAVRYLIRGMPLVHRFGRLVSFRMVHPYCAPSEATYCSWPHAKQAASEWLRAKTVVRLLSALQVKGAPWKTVWSTKKVYLWSRAHGYSPAIELSSPGNLSHKNEIYIKKLHSTSAPDKIMEWVTSVQDKRKNIKSEIDVIAAGSDEVMLNNEVEDSSNLPPIIGKPRMQGMISHVRQEVRRVRGKLGLERMTTDGSPAPVAAIILSHIAILLAEDLLRRALVNTIDRNGDLIEVGDVSKAILQRPEYDIFDKQGLDINISFKDMIKSKTVLD